MYCYKCGKELGEKVNFCPYCGAEQRAFEGDASCTDVYMENSDGAFRLVMTDEDFMNDRILFVG